jgi:outer membrane protein TolC
MSQPEMRSDRLRAELAEVKQQRDLLREALQALLGQTTNIEVLGEWEALDINFSSRKKARAKVEEVIGNARAALKATEAP